MIGEIIIEIFDGEMAYVGRAVGLNGPNRDLISITINAGSSHLRLKNYESTRNPNQIKRGYSRGPN